MRTPVKTFKLPLNILMIGLSTSLIFPASVKARSNLVPAAAIPAKSAVLVAQKQRIQFKKGTHSTEIKGGVVRGTINTYLIKAQKGQKMTIKIQSVEKNAVFNVVDTNIKTIIKESKSWSGVLSQTGDYQISVGTERGGSSYTMSVLIK